MTFWTDIKPIWRKYCSIWGYTIRWQRKHDFAASMLRNREILTKEEESRRWKIPAGPMLTLHMPNSALTAGWPAGMPTLSQAFTHSQKHAHTGSTRFTGDKPARVILAYFSAQSILEHWLHTETTTATEDEEQTQKAWWGIVKESYFSKKHSEGQ